MVMEDTFDQEPTVEMILHSIKNEVNAMNPAQLHGQLVQMEAMKLQNLAGQREIRTQLQQKAFAGEKEFLQQQQLELQEQEASIMEIIADITAKIGATRALGQ